MVDTVAINTGIKGVLSRKINGVEHVITYFSKTLSKAGRHYYVTKKKELLTVIQALQACYASLGDICGFRHEF